MDNATASVDGFGDGADFIGDVGTCIDITTDSVGDIGTDWTDRVVDSTGDVDICLGRAVGFVGDVDTC